MSASTSSKISGYKYQPESFLGLRPTSSTSVNPWFSGLIAITLSCIFFGVVYFLPENKFRAMMLDRGPTQFAALFLGFWCSTVLITKNIKLKIQVQALQRTVLPEDSAFVLSSQTADQVVHCIQQTAEDPRSFLLFDRILTAITTLKNLGKVSDIDKILNSVAEQDEETCESSFAILGGFLWAIPVLGFIGTVLGLSGAIAKFTGLLAAESDIQGIVDSLKGVTAELSTAFETTLVALVIALFVQLWMTAQRKKEADFLAKCRRYCLNNITTRIKILPYEQEREI